jgi:tetratricopeptide (TPR) repeat protein
VALFVDGVAMRGSRPIVAAALIAAFVAAGSAQKIVSDEERREAQKHYRSGQELMTAEKFDRAAEEFSKAIKNDPLFTLAYYFLGQSYGYQKRYAEAIKAYRDCIDACREVYALRQTNRFEADKRHDEEVRELRDTVSRMFHQAAPGSAQALRATQLEQQLQNMERNKPAIDAPFQPPAEVLLALGSALFRENKMAEAEAQWRAAIDANPKLGEAHNNLAVVYMLTDRFDESEREIKAAEANGYRVNPQLKDDLKKARARK